MIELIMATALNCAQPTIDNRVDNTRHMKTYKDALFYNVALVRCGQLFKNHPCVKEFRIKLDPWGDRMYSVVCSGNKKTVIPEIL